MKEEAPRQDLFEKIGLAPLEGVGMAVRKEWVILMREMDVSEVTNAVRELCVAANKRLPEDLTQCISSCAGCEEQALPQGIMQDLLDNLDAARELDIPVCQDTGMAVVFAEVGQEVHFTGGDFEAAVQEGVRRGYTEGLLRCSVVGDPLERINTGDNTPAVLHTRIVPGEKVTLTVAPKGFGSENMSRLQMLTPAAGRAGVVDFVLTQYEWRAATPARRWWSASGSAAILRAAPCWRNRRFAAGFPAEPKAVLRAIGGGAARTHQPAEHRPAGLWRQNDGFRCECGGWGDPHCRLAGCGQYWLPCYKHLKKFVNPLLFCAYVL